MSDYFVARAIEMTGGLKKKRILVIGVAYKPNVSDVRDTPAESLISKLRSKGAEVSWHDDLVRDWNGEKSIDLKPGFDLAIIASPHAYLDLKKLGDTLVLDTRGSI
jgi:UDP-N-acetyl-D-glucosamine dehydrogenase